MRLSWLFSLPAVLSVVSALAIEKRDADFFSVRTKMHKDMSGRRGDPKDKYFHESVFHPHYDGRFADQPLGYRERKQALSNLIQTYLATIADIGVETWLMHGTLLGWWWNRKILPWDSDSDVQVSESSMHYLASYYNMTVFHYKTPRIPEGRDYMLEINPHYVNREQSDEMNVIDARWIDTTSGLFIDITTARYNYTHPSGEGMLSCKDGHEYRDTYIFPLRETFFEGTPAKIPFAYKEVLEAEYEKKALTLTEFEGHRFDEDKLEWIPIPKDVKPEQQKQAQAQKKPEEKIDPAKLQQASPADGPTKESWGNVSKQPNTQKSPPADKTPDAKQPVKWKELAKIPQTHSGQPAIQGAANDKVFSKEEKRAAAVKKAEERRKAAEQKAIDAEVKRKKKEVKGKAAKARKFIDAPPKPKGTAR